MANQIILNQQTFRFKEITDQFPGGKGTKVKIFFQAELLSLENGNAKFGVIAYPAWRKKGRWELGYKICSAETGTSEPRAFPGAFGLANNELTLTPSKKKKKKKKGQKASKEFMKLFRKISCDPKLAEKAVFHCKTGFSENPHLEYDVTLEANGESARVGAKPSPPARPEP